ncbi:MAG: DUF4402 domain-containing protein [Alphaproteobacteria bacterium]|nr:DUF4402 domain-containing protein [Alphaproteobacteria bacterium]
MRKYFLTCAVAVLTVSTANAEDYTGTIQVSATVKNVTSISCSEMTFGDIYVPSNNPTSMLTLDYNSATGTLITGDNGVLANGIESARCIFQSSVENANVILPQMLILTNANNPEAALLVSQFTSGPAGHDSVGYYLGIGGTLFIPENIPVGEYTGSFSVLVTVE